MNICSPAILFLLFFIVSLSTSAQPTLIYYPISAEQIQGKIEQSHTFHRLDTSRYTDMPPRVKNLLTNAAGLFVAFKTNSTVIAAKWCVTGSKGLANLTSVVNKGLDLYIKSKNEWVYAGSGIPGQECSESVLVKNMSGEEKECLLYLPLYDETKSLQLGLDPASSFISMDNPFNKRVLVYGSSITQGASASRPGLAYPAMLSRMTGYSFINMGMSGSAKMEKSVADVVANADADAFILDCVPNSTPLQIKERTAYLVNAIRTRHPEKPVIMVESIVRESGNWDTTIALNVKQQNENFRSEYHKLKAKGIKKLYYVPADNLLGTDHEGTIDGVHPNDLGFYRMITVLKPAILKVLKKEKV